MKNIFVSSNTLIIGFKSCIRCFFSAFTFYSNRKLNYVNLEWNRIENLPPQLFHPDIHHSVAQVRLSHNKIARIHSHSFISFSAINLDLSYNGKQEDFSFIDVKTNSLLFVHSD